MKTNQSIYDSVYRDCQAGGMNETESHAYALERATPPSTQIKSGKSTPIPLGLLYRVEQTILSRLGRNVLLDGLSLMEIEQLIQAEKIYDNAQLEKTLNEMLGV